jgi:enoyl-CoA hydratase
MRCELLKQTAVLTLDRAPLNALDPDAIDALDQQLDGLERDPPREGLVITGAHDVFCAGVDTKAAAGADGQTKARIVLGLNRICARLYNLQAATVAAVNGHAIGAGLILALACDWRIGAPGRGKLGLPEVSAGLPYPDGPWAVVEAELSQPHLRRLAYDSGAVGPEAALGLGLIDALADGDMIVDRAVARARQLASFPAFLSTKRRLKQATHEKLVAFATSGTDTLLVDRRNL